MLGYINVWSLPAGGGLNIAVQVVFICNQVVAKDPSGANDKPLSLFLP